MTSHPSPNPSPAGEPTPLVDELLGTGRHRRDVQALRDEGRGIGVVRRITNDYLGTSKRRIPLVVLASLVVALAQAAILVVLAAAGVALAAGHKYVDLPLGPLSVHLSVAHAMITATCIAVGMVVVQVWSGTIAAGLAKIAEAESRRRLVEAYLGASWELVAKRERGEFQQLLTANVLRVSRALVNRTVFIFGITNLVVLLVAGFAVSPLVALLMVVAGALLALPLRPVKQRTQQAAEQHGEAERSFATFVAGMVEQARESRVFAIGPMLARRSDALADTAADKQRRMQFLLWTTPALYLGGAMLALTLGVSLVSVFGVSHLTSVGTMVVLFLRSMVYGQAALVAMQYIVEARPYLVEMENDLQTYEQSRRAATGVDPGPLDTLELLDVDYVYPGSAAPALRGVTLTIRRGEAIGVVGPTGSGKSTLAEVVLRLRDASSGRYVVSGVESTRVDTNAWSRLVAYVPQQAVIIDGTIRDNIRYYRPWITDAAVEQAARDAHIDAEIRRMPDGYDTVVAGLSVGLSGGQRQRICIARALAGQPQLLVMDEPTSGLDNRSEKLFIETINELRGERTLMIIAHRLDTIAMCDRLLHVEQGRIERITQQFVRPVPRLETVRPEPSRPAPRSDRSLREAPPARSAADAPGPAAGEPLAPSPYRPWADGARRPVVEPARRVPRTS